MKTRSPGSVLTLIRTLSNPESVRGMADGQLLELSFTKRDEGRAEAFAALMARHGLVVWDVCRSRMSDLQATEDAFLATFLILVRGAGSIGRRGSAGRSLRRIARRATAKAKAIVARRTLSEMQGKEVMAVPATADPARQRWERFEALRKEVDLLTVEYQTAFVLCYFEGRTHSEAAMVLRCPVATIRGRLSRACEILRPRLALRGLALPMAGVALGSHPAMAALPTGLVASTVEAAIHAAAGETMPPGIVTATVAQLLKEEPSRVIFSRLVCRRWRER
jgi:RNA polymerase sigma factor (sigma-70 family)